MIRFACPGCAASFTVADEKAGKSGKCPKCQSQFVIPAAGGSAPAPAATAPPKAEAAAADPVEIQPCPKCGAQLSVMASDIGLDIECPTCQRVFKALRTEVAAPGGGSKSSRRLEDDEDDRPSKKKSTRRDDDEDDDRPSKRRSSKRDDDEEERPSKKASRRGDDDEEERPSKKGSRRGDEDEEEERPSKKGSRRGDDEGEEEDRTPKRRSSRRDDDDDDDDDRPRKSKGRKGGGKGKIKESKKMTAGLLGIFLGAYGVHKFYLGYSGAGAIQLVVTFVTCGLGGVIGFIEGIIYLTKTDEDFIETYQRNEKQWF